MQSQYLWIVAAAMAMGIVGCGSSSQRPAANAIEPLLMSNLPAAPETPQGYSATNVNAIQLYDQGAADSTTGNGAPYKRN